MEGHIQKLAHKANRLQSSVNSLQLPTILTDLGKLFTIQLTCSTQSSSCLSVSRPPLISNFPTETHPSLCHHRGGP